jgi:hypothetical protein
MSAAFIAPVLLASVAGGNEAPPFGFIARMFLINTWAAEFNLDPAQSGRLAGIGIWPFAVSIIGFSLLSNISQTYAGFYFVQLEPWGERGDRVHGASGIAVCFSQHRKMTRRPHGQGVLRGVRLAQPQHRKRGRIGFGQHRFADEALGHRAVAGAAHERDRAGLRHPPEQYRTEAGPAVEVYANGRKRSRK